MKVYALIILMLLPLVAYPQVEFIEVVTREEMEAAQKKADDSMLMLFVDVYATWCGPCKMMDSQVYTDRDVADYMNANFVNVRMDGETDFGRKFAADQQMKGYPSMFIFSDKGDRISTIFGFRPAQEFLPALEKEVENYKVVKGYQKQYLLGTLTNESFAAYVNAVRETGNEEEAEKLAGEYIKQQMGKELRDHDIGVVAFYMDLEDPWWAEFTADPDRIQRVLGNKYLPAMEKIYNNTLVKAVETEDIVLISRMANELAPLVEIARRGSGDLKSLPFIQYYYYTGQVDELVNYVDRRFDTDRTGDHLWLYGAASRIIDMDQQHQTPELLKKGEEWFSVCISMEEKYDYYFYYGIVLFFQKKMDEARRSFAKATTLAANDEERAMVDQVLRYVNGR